MHWKLERSWLLPRLKQISPLGNSDASNKYFAHTQSVSSRDGNVAITLRSFLPRLVAVEVSQARNQVVVWLRV